MLNPHAINIYTDGSAKPNPGKSGYGIVIVYPDEQIHEIIPFGYKVSTNNRTELKACIDALKFLQTDPKTRNIQQLCIHSDSKYVVDGYQSVFYKWPNNGWKTFDGNDVDNQDLWKELVREVRKISKRVEIFKVKGHSGNENNERADKLADKSRSSAIRKDFSSERTQVRRWLNIPENKEDLKFKKNITVTVFVQRTDPRKTFFDAHCQVLKPLNHYGKRIKIRGNLDKHALRGAHIYKIKLKLFKDAFLIENILADLGKSKENKNLLYNE